jgi:fatty acid desaturase
MDYKKLLNWRFLLAGGIALWIILFLVSFIAVILRIVATILIIWGVVDLIIYLLKGRKEEKNKNSSDQH